MSTSGRRRLPLSPRFRRAAATVVEDAHDHVPDAEWYVARAEGADLVVVLGADGTPAKEGDVLRLRADADLRVPLVLPDGSVFGALCGVRDAGRASDGTSGNGGVGTRGASGGADARVPARKLERLADLLGAVLGAEWEAGEQASRADAEARRVRQVEEEALTDSLTGVSNRRAWDRALEAEERRRRRYGGDASVVVIDVDDLKRVNDSEGHLHGDLLLRLAAKTIASTSRDSDVVARTGGDEFAVLALDCPEPELGVLVGRIRRALEEEGVSASVGGACRRPQAGLAEAWAEADEVMYAEKARRKG